MPGRGFRAEAAQQRKSPSSGCKSGLRWRLQLAQAAVAGAAVCDGDCSWLFERRYLEPLQHLLLRHPWPLLPLPPLLGAARPIGLGRREGPCRALAAALALAAARPAAARPASAHQVQLQVGECGRRASLTLTIGAPPLG